MNIPLHPGTHLDDMPSLIKLRDEWVCATPHKRAAIIANILNEIEAYGDCYQIVLDEDRF